MHLLCIQTSFQKINITMTIYLIIEKIFIINSLRFKQLYCKCYKSFTEVSYSVLPELGING